jgi:ribose-phosphate pyrophosphokinase
MMYLVGTSAAHIKVAKDKQVKYALKKYPSGEMRVDISTDVKGQYVILIGSVLPDANSLLELLIAGDALKRKGAEVSIIILYLAYARQDKPEKGEAFVARTVCRTLRMGDYKKAYVIDVHNVKLRRFFRFENILPLSAFEKEIAGTRNPVIVAPDEGGVGRARAMTELTGGDIAYIKKKRLGPGKARSLNLRGEVSGKHAIIVDDIIDTGSTVIDAARLLAARGAKDVSVIATHGVFSGGAVKRLEKAPIRKITITNTLPVNTDSRKIKVVKIEPLIEAILSAMKRKDE